jgi:hypothetical protein
MRVLGRRVGVALLCGTLAVPLLPSPARAAERMRAVRDLPVGVSERLIVDASRRRIIALGGGGLADDYTRLTIIDGDTIRTLKTTTFPPYLPQEQRTRAPRVFAFDEAGRLLHVVVYRSGGPGGNTQQRNTFDPLLLTIDVDTLKPTGPARPLTLFPNGVRIMGARLWDHGRLGLVGQLIPEISPPDSAGTGAVSPPTSPLFGVFVGEVDPATGAKAWGPELVRGCQTVISAGDQAALALREETAFVGCGTGSAGTVTAPGSPAVVGVPIDGSQQSIYFLPGSYGDQGESYLDPAGGRLLLVGSSGDRPAQAVWVFDLAHRSFVGEVAGGELNVDGAGIDPATGRLYVAIGKTAAEGSLLVSTDRGIDIPQGRPFPLDVDVGPITPLPFSHTVIVTMRREPRIFRAYRDPLPDDAFAPSNPFDYRSYDRLLSDAPQFSGDTQAFGLRVHQIGGVDAMLQNVVFNPGGYYSQVAQLSCNAKPTCVEVKDRDRDLYFSRVRSAHLSQDEASAEAIRGDVDPGTQEDYRVIARASHGALKEDLPFEAAQCRDFGSGATSASPDGANVDCSRGDGEASADASYLGVGMKDVFSVGASSSTSSVHLDRTLGLVAEATSEARNVVIGGVVRIARITSGITVSAGRGHANAAYSRSFEGVRAGDFVCTSECDPTAVVRAISEALGLQFRVELPAREVLATPQGTHAHALREPWEHQQDVVLQNQDPTEQQVPALRVTHIDDNGLAARTIVEFAATEADVTSLRIGAGSPDGGVFKPPVAIVPIHLPGPRLVHDSVVPRAPSRGGILRRIVRTIGHGLHFAFGLGARSVALWILLAAPAFFVARRRHLVRLVRARS